MSLLLDTLYSPVRNQMERVGQKQCSTSSIPAVIINIVDNNCNSNDKPIRTYAVFIQCEYDIQCSKGWGSIHC